MSFPPKSLSILVVEDIATMRKMIKDSLRMMGLNNVLLAEHGEQAVSLLEANRIDLIISDSNMPKMNGIELLRYVRSSPTLRWIPFMMVTAESDRTAVSKAIKEGVTQFLIKPFTYADLQYRVNKISASHSPGKREAALPAEDRGAVREPFGHDLGKTTVLIVDPVTAAHQSVNRFLKQSHRIITAESGQEALKTVHDGPLPDLILLEVKMPELDGYETCRRLKQNPATAMIPVIFLTAQAKSADIANGFRAGGVDYIVKPADPTVLEARVATHIQIRQAKEDLRSHVDTVLENARLREDVERMTRHDIKSPLSAIISTADALLHTEDWTKPVSRALKTIRDAGYDALGMVNRTLDVYKMETGTYELKPAPVDLTKLAKRVMREVQSDADQKRIRISLRPEPDCFCLGEESLCLSLLRNLVKNAVEASPPDEVVFIVLNRREKVNLMIHNKGAVPDSLRETFFDKYSTANKDRGTGLGTYSARLMTEVQGGKIRFMSSQKQGTVLQVALNPAEAREAVDPSAGQKLFRQTG